MAREQDMALPGFGLASVRTEVDWNAEYAQLLPRVYNFFRYRVGPGAEAEDLAATTFAKAWRARARYRRDLASFRSWVFAIARNVAIDHFRARREYAPLAEAEQLAAPLAPEHDAERLANAARLSRLLQRLEPRDRDLIALKFGAALSHREIARALKLTESNVGTILHRAIASLRAEWHQGELP